MKLSWKASWKRRSIWLATSNESDNNARLPKKTVEAHRCCKNVIA